MTDSGNAETAVNDPRTQSASDTNLTQARSLDVPGWREIETAPRDGTRLLLFCDHGDDNPELGIGHWSLPIGKPGPFGHYVWKLQNDGGLVAERIVTHWMPLPAPPVRP